MAGTTRRRSDPEFQAGAVSIVKETGKPVAHIAINEYTPCTTACGRTGTRQGASGATATQAAN